MWVNMCRYFLRKLKKVKKSNGQVLAINEVYILLSLSIKHYPFVFASDLRFKTIEYIFAVNLLFVDDINTLNDTYNPSSRLLQYIDANIHICLD